MLNSELHVAHAWRIHDYLEEDNSLLFLCLPARGDLLKLKFDGSFKEGSIVGCG